MGVKYKESEPLSLDGNLALLSLPHTYLSSLLRTQTTKATNQRNLIQFVSDDEASCLSTLAPKSENFKIIPAVIHKPDHRDWFVSLDRSIDVDIIMSDQYERERFVSIHNPELLDIYSGLRNEDKVYLWSLISLYWLGGFYFGKGVRGIDSSLKAVISKYISRVDDGFPMGSKETCSSPLGFIIFPENSGTTEDDIAVMAVSPLHPFLKCALDGISSKRDTSSLRGLLDPIIQWRDNGFSEEGHAWSMYTPTEASCSLKTQGLDHIPTLKTSHQ